MNKHLQRFKTLEERFWEKVDKSPHPKGCWIWTAANCDGYGRFFKKGKIYQATYISYEFKNGKIPDGMLLLHKCDNPPCVNPDHLFLGTYKDNSDDAVSKKRIASGKNHGLRKHPECSAKGEDSGGAKLTEKQVFKIRRLRAMGISLTKVAAQFNITFSNVGHITRRSTWKHI